MLRKLQENYKKVKDIIRRIKTFRTLIEENKKYLKAGNYEFSSGLKPMMHNGERSTLEFVKKFDELSEMKIWRKVYLRTRKYYLDFEKSEDEITLFNGDLMMLVNNDDLKIFNYSENTLITIISETKRYERINQNIEKFSQYFNTTYIKKDNKEKLIVERIINFKPSQDYTECDIENFFNIFFKSLEKTIQVEVTEKTKSVTTKELLNNFEEKIADNEFVAEVKEMIPSNTCNDKWPIIPCHGDIKFDNVLLEDEVFYFIDWEATGDHLFFHDFIGFIFRKAVNADYKYLNRYLTGFYDEKLDDLFNASSAKYNCEKREYYLALYIINNIVNVDLNNYYYNFNDVLSRYRKVLNNIDL